MNDFSAHAEANTAVSSVARSAISDQGTGESAASGVSWGAVLAGAFLAASLGLSLTLLGVGLGLSSTSPWSGVGVGATAIGTGAVMWLIVSQAISAGLGGYVAGRLRVKWASVHTDEVFFRDTAHGLLVWAVGVAVAAAFLASAAASLVGVAGKATAAAGVAAAGSVAAAASSINAVSSMASTPGTSTATAGSSGSSTTPGPGYLTDSLFRSDRAASNDTQGLRAELGRIFSEALRTGAMPPADRTYAAQVIAAQTGLSQADAEARVDATFVKAKSAVSEAEQAARKAADDARRAAAKTAIWTFIALLVGAFCACVAATVGGDQRDKVLRAVG